MKSTNIFLSELEREKLGRQWLYRVTQPQRVLESYCAFLQIVNILWVTILYDGIRMWYPLKC